MALVAEKFSWHILEYAQEKKCLGTEVAESWQSYPPLIFPQSKFSYERLDVRHLCNKLTLP
jgi:hypothetical protein